MADIPPEPHKSHVLVMTEYLKVQRELDDSRRENDRLKKLLRLVHQHARKALDHESSPDSPCEPLRVELRWLVVIATTGGIGDPTQAEAPPAIDEQRRPAPPDILGPALAEGDGKIRP